MASRERRQSAGHLLAEHDGATGAVLREYVWLDDMPVAMIDRKPIKTPFGPWSPPTPMGNMRQTCSFVQER
jgi:hypothetical protein